MTRGNSAAERLRPWLATLAVSLAAGGAAVAGSYLAIGRQPAFVATPFDRLVVTYSPEALIAFAITQLGTLGQKLAFATAIALAAAVLGATVLPAAVALRQGRGPFAAVVGTVLPGLAALVITGSLASGVGAAIGAGLVVAVAWLSAGVDAPVDAGARRSVLGAVGAAVGLGVLGALLRGGGEARPDEQVEIPEDARPAVADALRTARERSLDVDGLEPLVSTGFYEVDINNVNPTVDPESWTLSVTGAVESEREYDLADLREMEREDRFVTLRCVGDQLNGYQMDNALWTGVPMAAILEAAGPTGGFVMFRAADDYYNEFPIEALWPGLLADEMNGRPLPRGHGAPARALVPGHWGEVNVKWLTEIEVLDRPAEGWWEKRGWQGTGPVNTVAKLHRVNHLSGGTIEVAGHAYAGTRGVRTVEVSTDGGDTWTEAELSERLPGEDVWRQWRHRYHARERHEVVVRAVDGTGTLQPREERHPKPSGATGWVSRVVLPE